MRTAHKVWSGIAAGVFCLVAIGDLSGQHGSGAAPAPSPVAGAASPAAAVPTAVPAAVPAATGRTVTVTDVIDGDTFVAAGRKVRVLGIDSCEASTSGGREATRTAETLLDGQQVTLRSEPGVDRDRYGRELRYVDLPSGADFGETMVGYDHTAVYAGHQDADPAYVATLRRDDPDGRTCSAPAPTTAPSSGQDDGDVSVPLPRPGDQGLPDGALTGGFCARHRWC